MNWVAPIKDDETLQKFRDALRSVDDKYYILFEIGIGTGLQLQDILQFKVKDVRGKDMLIAVIGTRQIEQAFPLKPELQAVITDFIDGRDDDEYLITGYASTHKPLSREQAYRIFKQTGNRIGLKSIGTQTMRKTFAWRYYKETGDIQYIQNLLNHASPNITFRYIYASMKLRRNAGHGRLPSVVFRSRPKLPRDAALRQTASCLPSNMPHETVWPVHHQPEIPHIPKHYYPYNAEVDRPSVHRNKHIPDRHHP